MGVAKQLCNLAVDGRKCQCCEIVFSRYEPAVATGDTIFWFSERVDEVTEPIAVDTDVRIGEGQHFDVIADFMIAVKQVVIFLTARLRFTGDVDLNILGSGGPAEGVSQVAQFGVGRVRFVSNNKPQQIIFIVLVKK